MKPAVSLVAVAGRRRATLDLAQRLEQEGFGGIYCPSPGDGLALCEALALVTREIAIGTSIANIYTRHVLEYAQMAAVVHELAPDSASASGSVTGRRTSGSGSVPASRSTT